MNKKIIDYVVVYSDLTGESIDKLVRKMIDQGYQPFGNLVVTIKPGFGREYYQAMVKYEE